MKQACQLSCIRRETRGLTSSSALLRLPFDLLYTAEDELFNKKKAYIFSTFTYWTMDFQSWWTFEQKFIENTGDFLKFLLKCLPYTHFYLVLYCFTMIIVYMIAVETFTNNNFISCLKRNFTAVWCKFRNSPILHILRPILSESLTALMMLTPKTSSAPPPTPNVV